MKTDSGAIVLGWVTQLVLFFAVTGLLLFDGMSLLVAKLAADDDARVASASAASEYRASHSVQDAYKAALGTLSDSSSHLDPETFLVAVDGSVSLTVVREPKTLWMDRIGPLRKYTVVRHEAVSTPPRR